MDWVFSQEAFLADVVTKPRGEFVVLGGCLENEDFLGQQLGEQHPFFHKFPTFRKAITYHHPTKEFYGENFLIVIGEKTWRRDLEILMRYLMVRSGLGGQNEKKE